MRPKDYVRLGLVAVVGLILLILFWQNAGTRVSVVTFGDRSEPMPLSIPVVISYIGGGLIGGLLLGNWWLHDYSSQRKAVRLLQRLEDRLYEVEERVGRRLHYLLPESLADQEFQARERLSVDDFGVEDEEDQADLMDDRAFEEDEDPRSEDIYQDEEDLPDERGWREERRWDY